MEKITLKELMQSVEGHLLKTGEKQSYTSVSIDSRTQNEGGIFFAIRGERTDGHAYIAQAVKAGAAAVVVHREDVPTNYENISVIKVRDTAEALLDFAGYYRSLFHIPIVAITGSSGKTTTKDIVASVLSVKYRTLKTQGNLNNQTGMPLTIFELDSSHEAAVIELGLCDQGEIGNMAKRLRPDIGIITNIGYSHLEKLKTRQGIYEEKTSLFSCFAAKNAAIVNRDDEYMKHYRSGDHAIIGIGIADGDIRATDIVQSQGGISFSVGGQIYHFALPGRHNVYNCLFAVAVGKMLHLTPEEIQKGFDSFAPSKNRMDFQDIAGVHIINDCYNSNPDAARAAVDVLGTKEGCGQKIAVLADMLELGEQANNLHEELGVYVAQKRIDILVAVGQQAAYLAQGALLSGMEKEKIKHFDNNEQATDFLSEVAQAGDCVLLKGSRGMRLEEVLTQFKERKRG